MRRMLLLLFVACSSSKTDPEPASNAFVARFELPSTGAPDLLAVPFPSDLQIAPDGVMQITAGTNDEPRGLNRLIANEKATRYLAESIARSRGFGVYGPALFELTGDTPDVAQLPTGQPGDCTKPGSPVMIVDLDDGRAEECHALFRKPSDESLAQALVVRTATGVPLREGHHIAVLLTSSLKGASGAPLAASPTFAALRDGARNTPAAQLYGLAIDSAASKVGIDKKSIVAAAVYTTGKVTDELFAARDLAAKTPAPTLKWGASDLAPVGAVRFSDKAGFTATLDAVLGPARKVGADDDLDFDPESTGLSHDAIGAFGTAAFDAPNFMILRETVADPDWDVFYRGADGKIAINPERPTARIWVTIAVPKAPAKNAEGYPIVVFQHGGGVDRGNTLRLANLFARKGWATVGIDLPRHGSRASEAAKRGDSKNDIGGKGATYAGPDGFSDILSSTFAQQQLEWLGGFYRLAAGRDHFRQIAIDHATLVRLLRASPDLPELASSDVVLKLDGSRIAYVGGSLGGITGSIVSSFDVGYRAYVLNVPPAGFFLDFPWAPNTYDQLVAAGALIYGLRDSDINPAHPLLAIGQHTFDGVEPIALASRVRLAGEKPRNVMIIEAMYDESVANASTEGLARAMGLPVLSPHARLHVPLTEASGGGFHDQPVAGATGALIQVSPAAHYSNIWSSKGGRSYAPEDPVFSDPNRAPFRKLATPENFVQPYAEQQAAIVAFIADAFDGKAPTVNWTLAPK